MRKITLSIITLVVLAAALSHAQEVKGPRIAVNELRYDAGKVVQGTQVSHVFEISNTGTATLVLERVQPS